MDFIFDFGWMAGGLLITLAGGLIVVFYRQISYGLANGVASFDKVKLVGVITVIVGLLCTSNLHLVVLNLIAKLFFGK